MLNVNLNQQLQKSVAEDHTSNDLTKITLSNEVDLSYTYDNYYSATNAPHML